MAKTEPSVETFTKDISTHAMTVLLYNGLYRHAKFKKPTDSWHHWFEIITWPGCLTINGDMGTWTFSRIEDMFSFFRCRNGLSINPAYWAEKLQSGSSGGYRQAKEFSMEDFSERLLDQLKKLLRLQGQTPRGASAGSQRQHIVFRQRTRGHVCRA